MDKLCFGTAGVPLSTKRKDTISGIERIKELGLDSMELEFVRGVNIREEIAHKVKDISQKLGIVLTAHGPYYINLCSLEEEKIQKSIGRIVDTARISNFCGAKKFTYHLGFYQKQNINYVYDIIKENLIEILDILKTNNYLPTMSPETSGKHTSIGSLEEILSLCRELNEIKPCIDFAHLYARTQGEYNNYDKFKEILDITKKSIGDEYFNDVYFHISGIEYNKQGEKKHLSLEESNFNYKDLLKLFKDYNLKGIIVCESPLLEEDALRLKEFYNKC